MNCETSTIMDTLHLFIAATLALVATAQGILLSLLSLSLGGCTCMHVCKYYLVCFTDLTGVSNCTNGDFELIQDPADTRIVGYVQYCFRGEWGRVCRWNGFTVLWDDSEVAVACRQLGYNLIGELNYSTKCMIMAVNVKDMHM